MQAQGFYIGVKSYSWGWQGDKRKTAYPTDDASVIFKLGRQILDYCWEGSGLYQIQVTALSPTPKGLQKDLFQEELKDPSHLNKTLDAINQKYGDYTMTTAQLLLKSKTNDVITPAWKPHGMRRSV